VRRNRWKTQYFVAELLVVNRDSFFDFFFIDANRFVFALATNSVFDLSGSGQKVLSASNALLLRLIFVCLHVRS
jgi:hypothetical protein